MTHLQSNNTLNKAALLIATVFLFNTAKSQKNFQPGYIITANRDTIKGSIDFKHWDKNPTKITFKEDNNGKTAMYQPADIIKFNVADESYESAIIGVDKTSDAVEDLSYSKELNLTSDTAFLYSLIDGVKSLYRYKDSDGKEHFFIKEDDRFSLLAYKTYLKESGAGNPGVAINNSYLNQLSTYLQGCSSVQVKLLDLKYTQSALKNVIEDYYICTNTALEKKKKADKIYNDFGAIAGLSSSTIKFTGTGFPYLTKVNYPASKDLAGGLFYNLYLGSPKWSLYNELLYTSLKANGYYKESIQGEEIYDTYNFSLRYSYINLKLMLRFTYPVNNVILFANAGVSNGFVVSEKNMLIAERKTYSQVSSVESEAIKNSGKNEQGILAGVGCRIKKVSIEARLGKGNGMSKLRSLNSSVNRSFLLIGYRF